MKKIKIRSLRDRIGIEVPNGQDEYGNDIWLKKKDIWACVFKTNAQDKSVDDISFVESRYLIIIRKESDIQHNMRIVHNGMRLKILVVDKESQAHFMHIKAEECLYG